MKRIPPIPPEGPTKPDDVAVRVAKCNPRTYEGKYDPVELEEWIRGMENIFAIVEVPENKKVNIRTFYLAGEVDIWWNTVKCRWQESELTWEKFIGELRAQFYSIALQRQKEKEFMELKMTGNMTVIQYTSKFMELSRFASDFVAFEWMKMRGFEEGLAFYIRN